MFKTLYRSFVDKTELYFAKLLTHTAVVGVVTFGLCWLYMHSRFRDVTIPSTMHALIGVVFGLLLVFRTNTSYDRWWEGRKAFGSLASTISSFNNRLKVVCHVRDQKKIRDSVGLFLDGLQAFFETKADHTRVHHKSQVKHLFNIVAAVKNAELSGFIDKADANELLRYCDAIMEHVSTLERIKDTPIPAAYAMHIKMSIFIYIISLPFGMFRDLGLWATAMVMLMFYVVAGIEIISGEIENPFAGDPNDLPTKSFIDDIKKILNE